MKMFPEMTFDERVAWARGHILVSVGEGRYQEAVWLVCQQFAQHPKTVSPPRVHHYWRGPGKRGALCGAKGGVIHDELNHIDAGGGGCKRCLVLIGKRMRKTHREMTRAASAPGRKGRSKWLLKR